jgi:hypothetical protein
MGQYCGTSNPIHEELYRKNQAAITTIVERGEAAKYIESEFPSFQRNAAKELDKQLPYSLEGIIGQEKLLQEKFG